MYHKKVGILSLWTISSSLLCWPIFWNSRYRLLTIFLKFSYLKLAKILILKTLLKKISLSHESSSHIISTLPVLIVILLNNLHWIALFILLTSLNFFLIYITYTLYLLLILRNILITRIIIVLLIIATGLCINRLH